MTYGIRTSIFLKLMTLFAWLISGFTNAQGNLKIPLSVRDQLLTIEQKFRAVVVEECDDKCYVNGCQILGYEALDSERNASLPGLDSPTKKQEKPQFQLKSLRCQYSAETHIDKAAREKLSRRIKQRTQVPGITLVVNSRSLEEKIDLAQSQEASLSGDSPVSLGKEKSNGQLFYEELLPFIPWFLLIMLIAGIIVLKNHLGRRKQAGDERFPVDLNKDSQEAKVSTTGDGGNGDPDNDVAWRIAEKKSAIQKILRDYPERISQSIYIIGDDKQRLDLLKGFIEIFGASSVKSIKHSSLENAAAELAKAAVNGSAEPLDPHAQLQLLEKWRKLLDLAVVIEPSEVIHPQLALAEKLDGPSILRLLNELSDSEKITLLNYLPRSMTDELLNNAGGQHSLKSELIAQLVEAPDASHQDLEDLNKKIQELFKTKGSQLKVATKNLDPKALLSMLSPAEQIKVLRQWSESGSQSLSEVFLPYSLRYLNAEQLNNIFLSFDPQESAFLLDRFHLEELGEKMNSKVFEPIQRALNKQSAAGSVSGGSLIEFKVSEILQKLQQVAKSLASAGIIDIEATNRELIRHE